MRVKAAEAIVQIMVKEGITDAFGIPGAGINPVYKYLENAPIAHYGMRHEEACTHAADAYFRASHKIALAICTAGPGATNFVTGLYTANIDSIPLLAIVGQANTWQLSQDPFQCVDMVSIADTVTKKVFRPMKAEEIPEMMREAFYLMREGKPGPVLIDFPLDVQMGELEFDIESYEPKEINKVMPDPEKIEKAIEMLSEAENPLIIMGGGVRLAEAEEALIRFAEEYQIPVKIRFCDTMGYGVPYPGATLPRSVPGIIYGINHFGQFPSELIEWHGHNDFYKAVVNATTAWLYGASSVNCSLLGIGERTGNTPLEAMVMEYAQIRGTLDGMDPTVITEIAEYYEKELGYKIPERTPFVGSDFNVTRAGIHADGVAKDEEIYNIFNTAKILNRPLGVEINKNSGSAGIAYWLNHNLQLEGKEKIDKNAPEVALLKDWVDKQYEDGRVAYISKEELISAMQELTPHLMAYVKE